MSYFARVRMQLSILLVFSFAITICSQTFFEDVAGELSISHSYENGIPGGGVSFQDFNNDGWDDITLATGPGQPLQFYQNTGGNFQLIPPFVHHNERAMQVIWVDFDNDGDKDFYITTFDGINRLFENTGAMAFVDITDQAQLPLNSGHSYGACWGDYNRDGWLDLYYADRKGSDNAHLNECRLFKNNADGTFTETTLYARVSDVGKKPFCSAFIDFNNDNWPDIYTAHDKLTINSLFLNARDGSFEDVSELTHTDHAMFAMCVTAGDYDNDGWQDIYVTNTVGNILLHNQGMAFNNTFEEKADALGVGFYGVGWGSVFLDSDNDKDLDLYVSGSLVGSDVISSHYYENKGSENFIIPEAGFSGDTVASYSNAVGDINNDGHFEILVSNNAPHHSHLWKSAPTNNNWIKINIEGIVSNRDGVGSRIDVYSSGIKQMRYTQCGSGFLGQNSSSQIIGIGDDEEVDSIHITWPSGHIDSFYDLIVNQRYDLIEGSSNNGIINIDEDLNILLTNTSDPPAQTTQFQLYPNPAHGIINIEQSDNGLSSYEIIDMQGRTIIRNHFSDYHHAVGVEHLDTGLYLMLLKNKKSGQQIIKWIKE